MALLASTTLGVDGSSVRALIRADETAGLNDASTYRLVVQSYDGSVEWSRPVGSTQRVLSGAELRVGVQVSLVELRAVAGTHVGPNDGSRGLVIAWIEEGTADLELDARRARPVAGSVYGETQKTPGSPSVRIALGRKLRIAA